MASSVFTRNPNFRPDTPYGGVGNTPVQGNGNPFTPVPAPEAVAPMTFENTMNKIVICFVAVLIGAGVGFFVPVLTLPAVLIGLALGIVNSVKKEPNKALILAYSLVQGVVAGGLSGILEQVQPGIISQAVLATFVVIATTLALYKSGKVRSSPKMTQFFMISLTAYFIFSLINLALMLTGVTNTAWGLHTEMKIFGIPLGLILGVFAVFLGTYSLILDFDFIKGGIAKHLPERFGWTAAFGIVATVVWIYVEILRLISIVRN